MTTTQIALAVAPLKQVSIDRAELAMTEALAKVQAEFEAAGCDLEVVAPYPNSRIYGTRKTYMPQVARYELFRRLTQRTAEGSRRPGTPDIAEWDAAAALRMVEGAKETAAADYEAFVAKLEAKVGEHSACAMIRSGTWAYSVLEVVTPAGTQRWKTQQIVNVSVLGKLFNQWPTRLMK